MAYTYAEALNVVARQLPKVLEDQYAAVACNLATTKIWDAKDWNESIKRLPPFYLIGGEQDHGPPQPIVPTDYQGLRRVQVQHVNGQVLGQLHVAQNLNEVWHEGLPEMISYEAAKRAFRLYPRVQRGYGAPNYFVTGTYKRLAPQITNSTLDTALPLKDKYFHVWLEGLRYAFYSLSGDPKAGRVSVQSGQRIFDGQMGVLNLAIHEAAATENLNQGEHAIFPSRPLANPRGYGRGW